MKNLDINKSTIMRQINKRIINRINIVNNKEAFTLIELLVVIALLGALIIGLFVSLDPLEQIRRGEDASLRGAALEFLNASNRYYAMRGYFPWGSDSISGRSLSSLESSINTLIDSGELKNNFLDVGRKYFNSIYVNSMTDPVFLSVCFMPVSKSMQKDPKTIYDSRGSQENSSSCKSQARSGGVNCYICIE